MGYDLIAKNKKAGDFHFGAFSWGPLISACGLLWPVMLDGGKWYCVWGADERMPEGDDCPRLISNDGMAIIADEAKIMARCARNLVAVQRSLPDANADQSAVGRKEVNRDDIMGIMVAAISGGTVNKEWPVKLRSDFVDKYDAFAVWADKCGGFTIH